MEAEDSTKERSPPLVSVIIPTYDRNEQLPETVRSVSTQTYDHIELFVVDDCSPVPVTEALEDMTLDHMHAVTIIRHNENRGANAARNNGIRAARGKYIAFLDDDDRWEDTKIERQVDAFESSDPEVGVVYTGKRSVGPHGERIKTPTVEGDVMKDLLTGQSFNQFSSLMVRSEVIEKVGLTDERFPAWQDREWLFRLAQHCHFKSVPEPLVVWQKKSGVSDNITGRYEQKRDVAFPLLIEKHYPVAREYGLYYARTFLASMRMTLARAAVKSGEYEEARKYFLLAVLGNPLYRPVYPHLLASLGGKWTYESAADFRRKLGTVTSMLG